MAKFGKPTDDDYIPPEKEDIVVPSRTNPQPYVQPMPTTAMPQAGMGAPTYGASMGMNTNPMMQQQQQQFQAQSAAAVIQAETDAKIAESNIDKQNENWMKSYWRPAMGWLYMLICLMDFVVFPAIAMFLPVILKGFGLQLQYVAWQSLTLSNGGLIHMAFGAILGVAAWTRGQEKIAGKA